MGPHRVALALCCCALLTNSCATTQDSGAHHAIPSNASGPLSESSWYFAVSGDSRDCGDLIMPKIANSIAAKRQQLPLKFYWHLGDFRALFRIDCDMALHMDPSFKCIQGDVSQSETPTMKQQYLQAAWPDFIENEVKPFEQAGIPIYLGIGNHELFDRKREEFRVAFKKWLTLPAITKQRKIDTARHIPSREGDSYFHFVMQGVDFISLDNTDRGVGFSSQQLKWLSRVLKADASDSSVKTIIVGMHAALPRSTSSNHAMDATCEGLCSGLAAYDLLEQAQHLNGAASRRKNVYVLASHSHFFEENIYNTDGHKGHVLPGWIVGTTGAEQYQSTIRYGYMLVEVKSDGTIGTSFVDVDRTSPPLLSGDVGDKLTSYCFEANKRLPPSQVAQNCHCSAP